MNEFKYKRSDAWLLQAILYSSKDGSSTLKDIIAMGDAINHAIFAPGELQQGLIRLFNGNIVTWIANKYSLTDSASEKFAHLRTNELNVFDARDEIAKIIGASPWSSKDILPEYDPDLEPMFFSMKDYKKACKNYRKEFWKLYKKIEKDEKQNT